MTKKEKVTIILELLHEHYGPTKCYLDHENAWQLLIATMLSAQCTDARVNLVTNGFIQEIHLCQGLCTGRSCRAGAGYSLDRLLS